MRRSGLLSLGLHLAVLAGLLLWFQHGGGSVGEIPDTLPAVELVMVEQKGAGPTAAPPVPVPVPQPNAEQDAAVEPLAPPPVPEAPPPAPVPPPPQVATAEPSEAVPLPPPPAAPAAPPSPAPPRPPQPPRRAAAPAAPAAAPEINLGGTDSETNAIALGPNVIPASLDAKYRNKEPVYPPDAVRHAQQGTVVVIAHVAPNGLAAGVDVALSSGYPSLDRAARDAVATWHFLPAVKDGRAIPFDMKLRVVFQLD